MEKELKKMLDKRTCRIPFKELESIIEALGWYCFVKDNKDFPYNTVCWYLCPNCEKHVNSNEMTKFLYACGYFNCTIDYRNKNIVVYA